MQCMEFYYNIQSDNGSIEDNNPLREWSLKFRQASQQAGKDLQAPTRLSSIMENAGLRVLAIRTLQIPLSTWNRNSKSLYTLVQKGCVVAIFPLCISLLCHGSPIAISSVSRRTHYAHLGRACW